MQGLGEISHGSKAQTKKNMKALNQNECNPEKARQTKPPVVKVPAFQQTPRKGLSQKKPKQQGSKATSTKTVVTRGQRSSMEKDLKRLARENRTPLDTPDSSWELRKRSQKDQDKDRQRRKQQQAKKGLYPLAKNVA